MGSIFQIYRVIKIVYYVTAISFLSLLGQKSQGMTRLHILLRVQIILFTSNSLRNDILLVVFANLTFPAILSKVFQELSILICEINTRLVWDKEVRD